MSVTAFPGNPNSRERLSTVDLPVLTSLDQLLFKFEILRTLVRKTSCFNEEVNCTEPSPSVGVFWLMPFKFVFEVRKLLLGMMYI
jgi:hypothetical protein